MQNFGWTNKEYYGIFLNVPTNCCYKAHSDNKARLAWFKVKNPFLELLSF